MTARRISYLLMAAAGLLIVRFNLGPALLAGLIAHLILDVTHRTLFSWDLPRRLRLDAARRAAGRSAPLQAVIADSALRVVSIAVFLLLASGLLWLFAIFLRLAVVRLPDILETAIPRLDLLARSYGYVLPFDTVAELRLLLGDKLKEHAGELSHASGLLTRRFFQITVVVFAAVGAFWSYKRAEDPAGPPSLYAAVVHELHDRVTLFLAGFERIFGAQVAISFINMWVTVVFLRTMGFPYVPFLGLSTFICGLLPLIGNLISNTIITGTALSISPQMAVFALAYLVVAHKAEYFLNSKIVGTSIDTPMWQVLLGILIGETVLGVPGVVLAPAVLHYVRAELRLLKA